MTHSASPGTPAGSGESLTDESAPPAEVAGSPESPLDRSRFSRWLASFGLGETTLPLLRPLKSSRQRGGR